MDKKYVIEVFDNKLHQTNNFSCGVVELDKYLKERAGQESRKKVAAVYILRESNSQRIIGYYTLSSYSIELTELPENIIRKLPKYKLLPAILMGRLAVDKKCQGKRIGEHLLIDALIRSYNLSKQIGSFSVVVDAKNEKARSFYEKYGFIRTLNFPFKLYVPMATIKNLTANQRI